jgi:hypothetical protein
MYLVFGDNSYCYVVDPVRGTLLTDKVKGTYIHVSKNNKEKINTIGYFCKSSLCYIADTEEEALTFAYKKTGYQKPYTINTMPNGRIAKVVSYDGQRNYNSSVVKECIGTLVYKINDKVFNITDKHVDFGGSSLDQFTNGLYEFELIPLGE